MEKENNFKQETIEDLINKLEKTYYRIKEIELKYLTLSKDLKISYPIIEIGKTKILSQIEQIKKWKEQIDVEEKNEDSKINTRKEILKELLKFELEKQYEEEMKKFFQKIFTEKIRKLMKESQIEKLQQEKEFLKKEKINFLGKIVGDYKIQFTKLEIINLKEKLIINQEKIQKQNISLEESLAEIYAYSFPTIKNHLTKELIEFIDVVKNNNTLQKMLNQEKLKEYIEKNVQQELKEHEKEGTIDTAKNKRELIQVLEQEKGRINRKLQNLRAKGLIKQNNEKEDNMQILNSKALEKFQKELQKWDIK